MKKVELTRGGRKGTFISVLGADNTAGTLLIMSGYRWNDEAETTKTKGALQPKIYCRNIEEASMITNNFFGGTKTLKEPFIFGSTTQTAIDRIYQTLHGNEGKILSKLGLRYGATIENTTNYQSDGRGVSSLVHISHERAPSPHIVPPLVGHSTICEFRDHSIMRHFVSSSFLYLLLFQSITQRIREVC